MASFDFIDNIINESFNNEESNTNNNQGTINKSNKLNKSNLTSELMDYNLLIFTDGAHERVKKRTSFGIYFQCLNKTSDMKKFNKMKIIKKITKDNLLYNLETKQIIYHSVFKSNNEFLCEVKDCKYFAIYNNANESIGKVCKQHKTDNMVQIVNFDIFEPSNIRAEGYGILYTLILLNIIHNKENKVIDSSELISNINNINLNNSITFTECKYYNLSKSLPDIKYDKYLIITDSEFWINVITKWSNNWFKKKVTFDKKNVDLIYYINYYLTILFDKNILIDFKFVRGHSDKDKTKKLDIFQKGNVMADKLANIAKDNNNYNVKIALE